MLNKIKEEKDSRGLVTTTYKNDAGEEVGFTQSSGCVFFDLGIDHPEKVENRECPTCKKEKSEMKNPWEWVDSKSPFQHGTGWDMPVYWQLVSGEDHKVYPLQRKEGEPLPEGIELHYENWRFASAEDAQVLLDWRSDRLTN